VPRSCFQPSTSVTDPNFIERHLNISPDGGDGSMEILLLVALVAIVDLLASRLATR
jgi:hypothetical protein